MRAWAALLVLSAALLVVSQAPGQASVANEKSAGSIYAELAKAPEKARAKPNPMESDPDAVAAGRNLFMQHCAECHGETAQGGRKGPSLRAAEVQNAEPGAIFWLLTNGVVRKGMPVWSKLPEPRRWQLVSYIKSLGAATGKPADPPPAKPQSVKATDSPSRRR